jgi:hypothetical protein
MCDANRVANPWALRFGAGSSEPEPSSSPVHWHFGVAWRASRKRGSRLRAGRSDRWLPTHGEGRSRPEPNPLCCRIGAGRKPRVGAASRRRAEGAAWRRDPEFVSDSRGRQGHGNRDAAGVGDGVRAESVRKAVAKGIRPDPLCGSEPAPSGEGSEARAAKGIARRCHTDGRIFLGNRQQRHR